MEDSINKRVMAYIKDKTITIKSLAAIIKVNDWKISTVSSDIFTEDLKRDLEPYKKESSNKSDKIDFFAITGD